MRKRENRSFQPFFPLSLLRPVLSRTALSPVFIEFPDKFRKLSTLPRSVLHSSCTLSFRINSCNCEHRKIYIDLYYNFCLYVKRKRKRIRTIFPHAKYLARPSRFAKTRVKSFFHRIFPVESFYSSNKLIPIKCSFYIYMSV